MLEDLRGGNPAKKMGSTKLVPSSIKNFRVPLFEYCIEPSTSAGWEQVYVCNGVIPC